MLHVNPNRPLLVVHVVEGEVLGLLRQPRLLERFLHLAGGELHLRTRGGHVPPGILAAAREQGLDLGELVARSPVVGSGAARHPEVSGREPPGQ